jgi:hypothetical protein
MAQSNTRISALAQTDLNRLKAALKAEFGIKANNGDIASALIHGTSVPQSIGMLLAYNRELSESEDDETTP